MQDIDFDEIDRAVNSATSTSPQTDTSAIVDTPEITEVPTQTQPMQSPAVRRSSGRFMDVVHPSSDMRPGGGSVRPSAPSAPSLHREEVPKREEAEGRPEPAAVSSAAFHWPDPIDIATSDEPKTVADVIEEEAPAEETPLISEPIVTEDDFEDDDEETAPLESPFLTDAKVEKRPLGAFSGADADLPLIEDPIPTSLTPVAQPEEIIAPAEPEVPELSHEEHDEAPEELHEDLLKLEGHGVENDDEPLLEATNPIEPMPVVEEEVPTGPTSITQQYKEQPSDTAQKSGAIFDTEAYHQPLVHATKKRSGVLIVVWIVALILVGGGIGAGIYFVALPMLG